MNSETKICQNCKSAFVIEPDDFAFYEKIKVPPSTWCPECRLVRRLHFSNERNLFHRKEDISGTEVVSIFPKDARFPVFSEKDWWSDKWDPMMYGVDFSKERPLFAQIKELMDKVPRAAILNIACVNCHYCAKASYSKDCYYNLSFSAENCMYGHYGRNVKDSADYLFLVKCELCYECIYCHGCTNLVFSAYSAYCRDSAFLYDCRNCHDCFGCVGLRNKSYYMFNEPFTKEEYERKIKEFDLGSYASLSNVRERTSKEWLKFPRKFANILRSENVVGDRVYGSKNCYFCFDVNPLELSVENCKYLLTATNVADSYDVGEIGEGSQLCYEIFEGWGSNIRFCNQTIDCRDVEYSFNCHSSSNLFACVGLRNKQYCILNKQYTKDEYERLVPVLRKHMDTMPYTDAAGRIYKYGEFFPSELSAFTYNESVASEYFPLTKEKAQAQGFLWKELDERSYVITKTTGKLPDRVQDADDSIANEIIECAHKKSCDEQCTGAFKIIPRELAFYRKLEFRYRVCAQIAGTEIEQGKEIRLRSGTVRANVLEQKAASTQTPQSTSTQTNPALTNLRPPMPPTARKSCIVKVATIAKSHESNFHPELVEGRELL